MKDLRIARWWTGETYGYPVTILSSSGQPPRISGALLTVGERWLAKHRGVSLEMLDEYGHKIWVSVLVPGYRVGVGIRVYPAWTHNDMRYWLVRARGVSLLCRRGNQEISQKAAEAVIRANHPVARRLMEEA